MKKDAISIRFRISLKDFDTEETIYMTEKAYNDISNGDKRMFFRGMDMIVDEYFTKEKIEKLKKELCDKIMNADNPFDIYDVDLDGYPVEENKIWR